MNIKTIVSIQQSATDTCVIFSDNVYVQYTRTLFCSTLTVRWPHCACDENKLCVSYLQPKFTEVSTLCH